MAAILKLKKSKCSGPPLTHAASFKNSKAAPGEDSVCFLCHDGGTLVMCDRRHCPKAYHPACVGRSLAFFNTKGAWFCARHFCSKCSKHPCTNCVMCTNSFCIKCLSCMSTELYLPLSEKEGLCKTCIAPVNTIELQLTAIAEGKTAVNFEDSKTVEFLFKEYWLLLKKFYGYSFTERQGFSCTESIPPSDSCDKVKGETPSKAQKISSNPETTIMQNTCTGLPRKEPISVLNSSRSSIRARHTSSSGSILPTKRKIRVLKLLNDSSSEDDNVNKPSSSKIVTSYCSKALAASKPVSPEITGAPPPSSVEAILQPSVLDGKDLGARPISVNKILSPSPPSKALPKVVDIDSIQPLLVAPNLKSPSSQTNMPQPKIYPPPFSTAEACKSPINFSRLFKEPHSNKVSTNTLSENNRVQRSSLACDGLLSQKESSESALLKSQTALASVHYKPFAMERPPALVAAKTQHQPSNVSCKPLSIKSHSLETRPATLDHHLQLPQLDTSKDVPSSNGASPDSKRTGSRAKPLKRPHRFIAQESCKSVDASLSICDKAEALAPITVQNVSRIYLRRSRLEELLSDQMFTLLVAGAFVRIRHSRHENNYRLVQIAGTSSLQAYHYQVGEKKTNVVLEVLNLNKQQRIRIDHVSNSMFTEEECQRLQQSVELGFINAPTMRALETKAAALKRGKAKKCLDEKLTEFSSKGASKGSSTSNKFRISGNKDGKASLSPDHLVKTQNQVGREKQVQADQVSICVESTARIAERSESFEAHAETALADNNGIEEQAASALFQQEIRQNILINCRIEENLKRKIQSNAEDEHACFNDAPISTSKQVDADQHSDISVEMSTAFADKGQNKVSSPEIFTALASKKCTEEEAELIRPTKVQKKGAEDEAESSPPTKLQKKGVQEFKANKYLAKEHWPSLMAEIMNQKQGDAPAEARIQHCDVVVDSATNIHGIAEDRMHAGMFPSSSDIRPGTKDVAPSNSPQGIPQTQSREYRVSNHPIDNDTCTIFQAKNQGCTEECITALVESNDSSKRPGDRMQWFYQDMKERTFGPFSLRQLRKWNRTTVFPPDLKIWRTVAGQKSSILLVDALNAQGMEAILGTQNSIAVESCPNLLNQTGIGSTESLSVCHTLSKEKSDDDAAATEKTDWPSLSAHAEQMLDSSLNLGNWTTQTEQMELKSGALWTSLQSTQFVPEDNRVFTNLKFENALNVSTDMIADGFWRLCTPATETAVRKKVERESDTKATKIKSNSTDSQPKETFAEGKRGVQSSAAHMLEKEISAVKEPEGNCSPACMEGKSSPACIEQDTFAPSDDGWSLSEIEKHKLGNVWSITQSSLFEVSKEKAASVQTSQCETPCNFEVLVSNSRPGMAIQQDRGTLADMGPNFQSLPEETPDRKREGYSVTQRQEMLNLDGGGNSPETCVFELETWATQYDALREKEASIKKCQDEILSSLIVAVTTEECKKSTPAHSNCHTLIEDTSVDGNMSCETEHMKKLAMLDDRKGPHVKVEQGTGRGSWNTSLNDGWGLPGKPEREIGWGSPDATLDDGWASPGEFEKRSGWGSPYASCFNQSEQRENLNSSHDTRSSKKSQLKQAEEKNTRAVGMHDGIQKDISSYKLCGRARRVSPEMHPEKGQRWTDSSHDHGKAQRVEDADCKGSSREQDTSLSRKSGCQRDVRYPNSAGGRASQFKDHAEFGKGTESRHGRSYPRESIIWSKEDKLCRGQGFFSDKRNTTPKATLREAETAFMRSHLGESDKQDGFKKGQKIFSKQLEVSAKVGYEKEDEVHSKERQASPEINESRIEREIRMFHARNEKRSSSREQRASPESARQNIEKNPKRSHSWKEWRSISKDRKTSPENAGYREHKRSYSRIDQRYMSREQMVLHDTAGERDVRRSHSGNDWEHTLREHASSERRGKRASHSRNDRRSFSKEQGASPENSGKITEKVDRVSRARSHRRSLSKETAASSRKIAGRREEEEDWETHSRENWRLYPRDQFLSRSVGDPFKSRFVSREQRGSSAYRSFPRKLNDDTHREASMEGRLKKNDYTQEEFQGRQRGPFPCKELIQLSSHIYCPKDSAVQPVQTSDQGWTSPESPSDHTARCWSLSTVGVGKSDDHFISSDIASKPEAHSEHIWSDSYAQLPPPLPLPVSTLKSQLMPPPPPLPADASHICHIDKYNV